MPAASGTPHLRVNEVVEDEKTGEVLHIVDGDTAVSRRARRYGA